MSNSPRPGVWALERSVDHGKNWEAWQYFAGNDRECQKFFGDYSFETREIRRIESDDEVEYSYFFVKTNHKKTHMWFPAMFYVF